MSVKGISPFNRCYGQRRTGQSVSALMRRLKKVLFLYKRAKIVFKKRKVEATGISEQVCLARKCSLKEDA